MKAKKTVVFTGGGSSGHVYPNLPIIEQLSADGWVIVYIGSHGGLEGEIVRKAGIPFMAIQTGKLRRYWSWQNFIDPARMLLGVAQALRLLRRIRPQVVYSKGGFVSVPVALAAKLLGIPVILHESDLTLGLANRIIAPLADTICVTFAATQLSERQQAKAIVSGTPIREQFEQADAARGRRYLAFDDDKPIVVVVGGSQGAAAINGVVRQALDQLTASYYVAHICGPGKVDFAYNGVAGYRQFEYISERYADVMAAAAVVISRAGAGSLYELLALRKAHILIPLPLHASRGDQILNARHFEAQQISFVIMEEALNGERLLSTLAEVVAEREQIVARIARLQIPNATAMLTELVKRYAAAG